MSASTSFRTGEKHLVTAKLIDGKELANSIKTEIAQECAALWEKSQIKPGLAAVLVGDNSASHLYVRNKRKACAKVGMESWLHELPESTTEEELLQLVDQLNEDPAVHGILVQLPLPAHIDEDTVIDRVSVAKDVDGFSTTNLGRLAAGEPGFLPCTPLGIQQMLMRSEIEIEGKHVVIVGRSRIVGTPLSLMLTRKAPGGNATVTLCHSRTADVASFTRQADIIIMAIGKPRYLTADMVREGVAVIDVGTNRVDEQWVGDVDFDAVREKASAISPVPGGVGPMTITMLLHNTLQSAKQSVDAQI